jgi:DHA1 family inner membrane transport protein
VLLSVDPSSPPRPSGWIGGPSSGALLLFVAADLAAVAAAGLATVVAVRVFTGGLHGLFVATAFSAGMAVVLPQRASWVISVVLSGVAVSAAPGIPFGTLLGQAVGWRGSFVAVAGFALWPCWRSTSSAGSPCW